jgi:hypothetical protein
MPTQTEILLELEGRGALPPNKQLLIDELRKRGEFPQQSPGVTSPQAPSLALEETPISGSARPLPPEQAGGIDIIGRIKEELPKTVRPTLEAIGSIGGAALGATGGPAGIVAGGALGFAAARELGDIVLGEQNENLGEELIEAGENVLEGAKLEMLGHSFGGLLTQSGRALGKIGVHTKPVSKKIAGRIERLKAAQRLDVPVTAGEATESTTMQKAENFLRKLITPAGQFQRYDQKRLDGLLRARFDLVNDVTKGIKRKESAEALGIQIQKEIDSLLAGKVQAKGRVLDKMRDEVLEVFGSTESYKSLGQTTKELVETNQRKLEGLATDYFNKARTALPAGGSDIIPSTKTVLSINKAIKEEGKALTAVGQRNINLLNSIKDDFISKPNSFDELVRRRSDLNDIISRLETTTGIPGEEQLVISGKKASRFFKSIKSALDDDLAAFAKSVGGDSDTFVKMGVETSKRKFDFIKNPAIKQIMRTEPEKVLDIVLRPKQVALAKILRKEMGETGISPLREAATNNLLGIGIDEPFTGMALKNRMKAAGTDTLRELLGEKQFIALNDLSHKAIAQDKIVARLRTTGTVPRGLELGIRDLASNRFFRTLLRNQKPQNLVDIIYQPGNSINVKRTYATLRQMGKADKIQDLKATQLERWIKTDPKTGLFHPNTLAKELQNLDDPMLKAAFSPEELRGIQDIAKVSLLIDPKVQAGAGLEVIRFVAEPVAKPLAWAYLRKDGRSLLKQAIKQQAKGFTAKQRNATLVKLLAIGIKAESEAKTRNFSPENISPQIPQLSGAL